MGDGGIQGEMEWEYEIHLSVPTKPWVLLRVKVKRNNVESVGGTIYVYATVVHHYTYTTLVARRN